IFLEPRICAGTTRAAELRLYGCRCFRKFFFEIETHGEQAVQSFANSPFLGLQTIESAEVDLTLVGHHELPAEFKFLELRFAILHLIRYLRQFGGQKLCRTKHLRLTSLAILLEKQRGQLGSDLLGKFRILIAIRDPKIRKWKANSCPL